MEYSKPSQCKECFQTHGKPLTIELNAFCCACGQPAHHTMGKMIFICRPCSIKWMEFIKPYELTKLHWRQQKVMWDHAFIKFLTKEEKAVRNG